MTGYFEILDTPSYKNKSPFRVTSIRFYESIEDAVRANQDLTNNDKGNCWDENTTLKPGVKISCSLSPGLDVSYPYEGKKGEKITITVSAVNFLPKIFIFNANGKIIDSYQNEQKQNSLTGVKILPYSGKYIFEIEKDDARLATDAKINYPFTITLTSDKSNVQPDPRKDRLVTGKNILFMN